MIWWLALRRRKRLWRGIENAVMRDYLSSHLLPSSSHFLETEFLAVDLETTALNANEGEIASIGWVPISHGNIQLPGAEHYYSKVRSGVGQSAVIHQIHDSELDAALPIVELMDRFLAVAAGKVLVFHNASLDMDFLNNIARKLYAAPVISPVVDTLLLEQRKLQRADIALKPGALRLHGCRHRYGLPDYPAHDALTDALATAELLLAWAAHAGGKKGVKLSDCLA